MSNSSSNNNRPPTHVIDDDDDMMIDESMHMLEHQPLRSNEDEDDDDEQLLHQHQHHEERVNWWHWANCYDSCVGLYRNCASGCRNHAREVRFGYLLFLLLVLMISLSKDPSYYIIALALLCSISISFCLRLWLIRRQQHRLRQQRELLPRNELELTRLLQSMGISPAQARLTMMDRDFNPNDYETLMALDEEHRAQVLTGLPQSQIERLPVYTMPAVGANDTNNNDASGDQCSICLDKVSPGDRVRTVPCLHRFHADCIDTWLRTKATCPVCSLRINLSS